MRKILIEGDSLLSMAASPAASGGAGLQTPRSTRIRNAFAKAPAISSPSTSAIAPPWENKRLQTAIDTASHASTAAAVEHLKDAEAVVANTYHKGGLVLAGTDSPLDVPAISLHLNLRAQVKYGNLAPWQALETATSLPARAYGLSNDLGTLEPGHLADVIIVAGDPLKGISDVARVQCVAKNGYLQSVGAIMVPFAKSDTGENIFPAR